MKLLWVMLVIGCTGCTTIPEKCEPVTVVKEVPIPVLVKCKVTFPVKPVMDVKSVMALGMYEKGMFILSEDQAYRQYANELEAALKACADSP